MRHIAFRTDASSQIGTGHFMRCLTLADALKQRGAQIRFVSRELPVHLRDMLAARNIEFIALERDTNPSPTDDLVHAKWLGTSQAEDAQSSIQALSSQLWDWLIVDHYALDARWESALRRTVKQIMVIDDIADRQHDCDVLLDQNLYTGMGGRYKGLIKADCTQLLGPGYALLRREFVDVRESLRLRDGSIKRVLIFFGGSDATNETGKALDAIAMLNLTNLEFDVVIGATNPLREALTAKCAKLPSVRLHCQVSHMGALMASADLALGAGGTATWERCAMGLPALVVSVADNQVGIAKGVEQANGHRYLGMCSKVSATMLTAAIIAARGDPAMLEEMSKAALTLVDTHGTARVVAALKDFV